MDQENAGHDDDDYIPWADPSIKTDYESSLGRFLVQFNALEAIIAEILVCSVRHLGGPDINFRNDTFDAKLKSLKLIGLALPRMAKPNYDELHRISAERNKLAHGHFDQNPYSGKFEVVVREKSLVTNATEIDALSQRAHAVWDALRDCQAYLAFVEPLSVGID